MTLLLAAFLLLPSMASVGMFLDGLIYASVSRNLAEGTGSLWAPSFSEGLFPVFFEHPPLVFWLQSLWFRLLGDSYLTERAYDLAIVVATAALIRALWLRLTQSAGLERLAGYWWLPLLCWVLVPKWSWAYRSNVLENTMTLWCLCAVLLLHHSMLAGTRSRAIAAVLAAASATSAAFLSKGLPALFVVVVPLLLLPALPGVTAARALGIGALHCALIAVLLGLLALLPEARALFELWWADQVVARTGLGSGWTILAELAKKLVPMGVVASIAWLAVRRVLHTGWWRGTVGPSAAMLCIGLSASVPLVVGDRDSGHYLLPSLPFYSLGFGVIAAAALDGGGAAIRRRLERKPGLPFSIGAAALAVAIVAICAVRVGEVRKNHAYHALFDRVAAVTGNDARIGVSREIYGDWMLHAVAQRYHRIALVPMDTTTWGLAPRSAPPPERSIAATSGDWLLLRPANGAE